jgi:hypothetical protein
METKKRRWRGSLRKPIYVGSIPIGGTNKELPEWIEQEVIEKLQLLMEHYRIADKNDYFSLALALAMDHVPGFQVKQAALKLKYGNWGAVIHANRGRRITWPPDRVSRLAEAVEKAKKTQKLSTNREALRWVVTRNKEWSRPANHRGDLEQWLKTLENRLSHAKQFPSIPRIRVRQNPGK